RCTGVVSFFLPVRFGTRSRHKSPDWRPRSRQQETCAMTPAEIGARLGAVLPKELVDVSEITLSVNARDGGFYEYRPKAVVRVTSEHDVRGLFAISPELRL